MKFGQNPSFGSRDRVLFWSKFQRAGVTLKTRSRSPKSNSFLPPNNVPVQVWSKPTLWFGSADNEQRRHRWDPYQKQYVPPPPSVLNLNVNTQDPRVAVPKSYKIYCNIILKTRSKTSQKLLKTFLDSLLSGFQKACMYILQVIYCRYFSFRLLRLNKYVSRNAILNQ